MPKPSSEAWWWRNHGLGMLCSCWSWEAAQDRWHNKQGALHKILKYCAISSLKHIFNNEEAIFQHDNAPWHTAKAVIEWANKNNLKILDWPGNSPDMNPIENIWDYIQRKIDDCHFKTKDDLYDKDKEEWKSLPKSYIENLIDSMPRRIDTVIKAKGGSTRY